MPDVSIVLPTFNERESLQRLDLRLRAALHGISAEVLVVDDSSPDRTGALVNELAQHGLYRLLERPGRRGLATAVVDGIRASRGRFLVVMDADGSHPPEMLPELLRSLVAGEAEFVLASRWAPGGSAPGLLGKRRWLSRIAGALARPMARVRDPMSGYFGFDRRILQRAPLSPIGFKIGLEILVKCRPFPVRELPFRFDARLAGESKLHRAEIGRFLRHLGRLYAWEIGGPIRPRTTR